MIKKLFPSLFFILLFSFTLNAQVDKSGGYARVLGLGNNPYVIDPEFIKVNPAWTSEYYHFLWGDIGAYTGQPFSNLSGGQFIGVTFATCEHFTVGAMLTRNDFRSFSIATLDPMSFYGMGVVNSVNSIEGTGTVVPLNNNVEALVSYRERKFSIGLGVSYAATTNSTELASGQNINGKASQFGINAGLLARFNRQMFLDFGLSYILPSAAYEPATSNKTEFKQSIILSQARLFWKLSSRVRIIPAAELFYTSGTGLVGGISGDMPSVFNFGVGLGLEYVYGDFKFIGGPSFSSQTITLPEIENVSPELTNTITTFPGWNIGAEWYTTDWLIARLGYIAITQTNDVETAASLTQINETTTTNFGPTGFIFGIGLRFGDFSLEATVNDDVLRQGFNNIGGGGPTFSYLSTSYAF